jgi:TRAP-type C4-dicarboxylate transport system substrate-binding protein
MQLTLDFPATPDSSTPLWDELDPEARRAFLQALARVIAQAMRHPQTEKNQEEPHDR